MTEIPEADRAEQNTPLTVDDEEPPELVLDDDAAVPNANEADALEQSISLPRDPEED